MNVPVTLGGFPASWRFRDSGGLDAWLGELPWAGTGGARLVRIASAGLAGEMARAIRRAVRGHDDGDRDVQVYLVEPGEAAAGLQAVLRGVLGLPDEPDPSDRRSFLSSAGRLLAGWPTVIVLPAVEPGADPRLWRDAQEIAAGVARAQPDAQATIVLLDTPAAPLADEAFDLTVGALADPVLADPDRRDVELWRAYVHARLAWESAGDLARALAWDERGFRGVAFAADNIVENLLNQCAEAAYRDLPAATREQALAQLRQMVARKGGPGQGAEELVRAGAFWRPVGESQPRPAPWLARAMLRSGECPEAGFYLRGCLVCAPLAREVLSHCFDLEWRQRAIGWAQRGTFRPPPEAEERFRKFQQMQPGSGAEFYPPDCPAAPADGWAFTVFGEFIASLPLERQQLGVHHDLRSLRNALAHGHYISWNMLMTLRRIERQLAG
jgi:hypothetical protein